MDWRGMLTLFIYYYGIANYIGIQLDKLVSLSEKMLIDF